MQIVKILALIFIITAVIFGGLQAFNWLSRSGADLTLLSLWQRISVSGPNQIRALLPGGMAQDVFSAILGAPAWLGSLILGGVLWAIARIFGDED
jgi:hypothetical protein